MLRKTTTADATSQAWKSLSHVLADRAKRHPDRPALTFLDDSVGVASDSVGITLSYAELDARSRSLAARLAEVSNPGDRALLLFPPGIEFLVAFLACQSTRLIPVPTCFPKPGRSMPRLDAAARDCAPTILLGDQATLAGLDPSRLAPEVNSTIRVATDLANHVPTGWVADFDAISIDDLGLLQYTSGSTSDPKGVMVSHANLLSNLEAIREAFCIDWADDESDEISRGVFWLPPFHDMGLIGGLLEAIYVGGHTVLMSPRAFLHRPLRWLETISHFKANISGAPNFAYQLCVDRIDADQVRQLDLSDWDLAFCGAEPIHAETLERFAAKFAPAGFRASSYCPCYGLAESTLLASGGVRTTGPSFLHVDRHDLSTGRATVVETSDPTEIQLDRLGKSTSNDVSVKPNVASSTRRLVSCGEPALGTTLRIVSPDQFASVRDGEIGEIWLQGPSVTRGYWRRDEENARMFAATIADDLSAGTFCRTGDLGFLHENRLFVTGRCKDVIILRGRNLYPQDIEATVRRALHADVVQCVAIATSGPQGDALAIIVEVSRHMDDEKMPDIVRTLRRAVIDEHEVDARTVVLTRPGAIPLTTSGKVQRQACRAMLENDDITARYRWSRAVVVDDTGSTTLPELPTKIERDQIDAGAAQIEAWLCAWLVLRGGIGADQVHRDTPFADYGLDSLAAVELSGELEDWLGLELTPILAWNYPTPQRLAQHLAIEMAGGQPAHVTASEGSVALDESAALADFESLLLEIEALSDDEI